MNASLNADIPATKPKRKTYAARRFVSLGFGIANTLLLIGYMAFAWVYYVLAVNGVGGSYYADRFLLISEIFVLIAAVMAVGAIVSWVMFGIYSSKRKKALALIKIEAEIAASSVAESAKAESERTIELENVLEEQMDYLKIAPEDMSGGFGFPY